MRTMTTLKYMGVLIFSSLIIAQLGCTFHHYDEKTQTDHIWGFGHMKMKLSTPNEGVKAAITETNVMGLGMSNAEGGLSFIGGVNKQSKTEILDENAAVRIEWPTNNMFDIRVGTKPPFIEQDEPAEDQEAESTNLESEGMPSASTDPESDEIDPELADIEPEGADSEASEGLSGLKPRDRRILPGRPVFYEDLPSF